MSEAFQSFEQKQQHVGHIHGASFSIWKESNWYTLLTTLKLR